MSDAVNTSSAQEKPATPTQAVPWREAMRRRPTLCIGDPDEQGYNHMIQIVVDQSLNEVLAGVATQIDVVIDQAGGITVRDNGRGLPMEDESMEHKPVLERIMTDPSAYDQVVFKQYAAGMALEIPTGLACVNALAEWLQVESRWAGKVYRQQYQQGRVCGPVEIIGDDPVGHGTTISFKADPLIFGTSECNADLLVAYFQEVCYLVRGTTIHLEDQRPGKERVVTLGCIDGINTWVQHLNRYALNEIPPHPWHVTSLVEGTFIEVGLQYDWTTRTPQILSFVNNQRTIRGGTHVQGFLRALVRAFNKYGRKHGILTENEANLRTREVQNGLCAIVNVRLVRPRIGDGSERLYSTGVDRLVEQVVRPAWEAFLEANPQSAERLIQARAQQVSHNSDRTD